MASAAPPRGRNEDSGGRTTGVRGGHELDEAAQNALTPGGSGGGPPKRLALANAQAEIMNSIGQLTPSR